MLGRDDEADDIATAQDEGAGLRLLEGDAELVAPPRVEHAPWEGHEEALGVGDQRGVAVERLRVEEGFVLVDEEAVAGVDGGRVDGPEEGEPLAVVLEAVEADLGGRRGRGWRRRLVGVLQGAADELRGRDFLEGAVFQGGRGCADGAGAVRRR